MKRFQQSGLVALLFFSLCTWPLLGDDLSDLADLSDHPPETSAPEIDDLSGAAELDFSLMEDDDSEEGDSSEFSISLGGYLKTLAYWNEERYSDQLWEYYQGLALAGNPVPAERKLSGFNNIGTRMQLKLEGYLGDKARLFSVFNLNYNLAGSVHEENDDTDEEEMTEIRLVESFIELYEGNRTWKVGSQIVTWGYMEGIEVPTDRLNARDESYKSTEYEDSKLPSTGILLMQNLGDHQLELMVIPVSKQNKAPEFNEYLYTGTDEEPEKKPNKAKWAGRYVGTIGNLDLALSYIEGLDNAPDLNATGDAKVYNRTKSPGLDLQYNFGSFLAKLSGAYYYTEDSEGDDPHIKNNWGKYAVGTEFIIGGATINLYAGQILIADFKDDAQSQSANLLLGQIRERTDFLSGHINADFLTGNALNLVLMAAGYWDEDGKAVQSIAKATVTYKIADGLELLCSPMYVDYMENILVDVQAEVKYSF